MEDKLDNKEIRELAKKRMESKPLAIPVSKTDAIELVQELGIHQEELSIQNEELRRIQIELEESRAKYFELYDLAPVGYITVTKNLIIKESNLAASTLLGMERTDLINKGLSTFVKESSHEQLYLHFKKLGNGPRKQINQIVFERKDGTEILVQFESNQIESEFGQGFRSILTDITEQTKSERFANELNLINSKISSSFDFDDILKQVVISASEAMNKAGTTISVWELDDWVIKYEYNLPLKVTDLPVSVKLAKLSNLTVESKDVLSVQDVQKDPRTLDFSEDGFGLRSAIAAPLIIDGEVIGILSFTYFDNIRKFTPTEVDFTKKLASMISVTLANARLYESMRENETKYRGLFENLGIAISLRRLVFDKRGEVIDEIVVDINSAAMRDLGNIDIDDVIGTSISEILSPKMFEKALEKTREMRKTGRAASEVMLFDLNNRHYLTTYMPLKNDQIIVTSVDITNQKELEEELKRSNLDLQQFASVASHDLKEPLRMVSSYLYLLDKVNRENWNEASKEYMHFALDGAQRMQAMVNDLLTFARVASDSSPFTLVDMNEVLETALNDLKVSMQENEASIVREHLPAVMADRAQMVLLLENLLGNAIKYRGQAAPEVQISMVEHSIDWTFSIKDNGIGIDPKYQDRLFQIFQRLHTQEKYKGTGMGLAIAKRIVERHGGRIWFDSEEGKGANFFFTVPKGQ
jgi:PAS domain S-box-containing protein